MIGGVVLFAPRKVLAMSTGTLPDSLLARRTVLLGAGLAAGLSAAAVAAPARSALRSKGLPDWNDPDECLKLYVKMTSDLSGRPVYGWQQGLLYGARPNEIIRPLLGMKGFGCGAVLRQKDGTYQSLWKEVLYYTDLTTGLVLENWKNPYNATACEVMHVHNRSVNMTLKAHLPDFPPPKPPANMEFGYASPQTADMPSHPFYLPTAVAGGIATIFSEARGYVPNKLDPKIWPRESTGDHISVGEFFMNSGSVDQLLDPAVTAVDSHGSWTRSGPWLPWMLMGGQPGNLLYRSVTKKLLSADQVPDDVLEYTRLHYPDFLTPPRDFNAPQETSWDVFMRERKPAPPL